MLLASFSTDLAFSLAAQDDDMARLMAFFPERLSIEKTDEATDRQGADYAIYLPSGDVETVDIKRRRPGCERFWASPHVPELALELVADVESNKPGWATSESDVPDWFLFAFPSRSYL